MTEETETKTLLEKLTELITMQQAQIKEIVSLQKQTREPNTSGAPNPEVVTSPIYIKFDGTNYPIWSQVVTLYIKGRDKTNHIIGDQLPPKVGDVAYQKWSTEDSVVKGWLLNSLDLNLMPNFIRYETAKEMWQALETAYHDNNDEALVFDLNRKVLQLKHTGKLEDYYNGLQGLWREIDFRRPNPMTSAPDIEKFREYIEKSRVYTFLANLNDRLDNIRASVLQCTPFPTVEHAYGMELREATRQAVMMKEEEGMSQNSMVMYSKGFSSSNSQDRSKLKCTQCGRTGHLKEKCFEIVGYPEWFKGKKGKQQGRSQASVDMRGAGAPAENDAVEDQSTRSGAGAPAEKQAV